MNVSVARLVLGCNASATEPEILSAFRQALERHYRDLLEELDRDADEDTRVLIEARDILIATLGSRRRNDQAEFASSREHTDKRYAGQSGDFDQNSVPWSHPDTSKTENVARLLAGRTLVCCIAFGALATAAMSVYELPSYAPSLGIIAAHAKVISIIIAACISGFLVIVFFPQILMVMLVYLFVTVFYGYYKAAVETVSQSSNIPTTGDKPAKVKVKPR